MTEPTAELMLEILRRMQADLADLKEGQRTANVRLSAIEHHLAGFLASGVAQHDELERLKRPASHGLSAGLTLPTRPSPRTRFEPRLAAPTCRRQHARG